MTNGYVPFQEYSFNHGFARYAQWGEWEHVFTASQDDSDILRNATDDLCGSDYEAICASRTINDMVRDKTAFLGTDIDPIKALQKCIDKIKEYNND